MSGGGLINLSLILGSLSGVPLLIRVLPLSIASLASVIALCLASISGCAGAIAILVSSSPVEFYTLSLGIPYGPFEIGIDRLSAWFLLPINLVCGCAALFGWRYWGSSHPPGTIRRLGLFLGLLYGSMVLVVMARNTVLFLIAYEVMAISAYVAMTVSDERAEVREAGTLYLIMAHLCALALFALFAQIASRTGSFLMPQSGTLALQVPAATGLLFLALLGFGGKAGIMPLHVWLPSAHAAAPSHISAIMSGVILKIGIYGLIRTLSFFHHIPLWWGMLFLLLGAVSGVAGVVFALGQHDMKRLLAYHSIENIGIIVMGIGIYCIGAGSASLPLMVLGMAGALLHVLNHALFKALLFLSAGAAIHCAGTREIDRMGGLARPMPTTAFMFGLGAVAICGLPPLNGFVSEFFIYLGLFRGIQSSPGIAPPVMGLAAPILALIGGLAVACFVKVYGVAFLGLPRHGSGEGHEAAPSMHAAMGILAAVCIAIGTMPILIAPLLDASIATMLPAGSPALPLAAFAPLLPISYAAGLLLALIILLMFWYRRRLAAAPRSSAPTWGCGYLAPTPRMQYTASSFAATLVELFSPLLRPRGGSPKVMGPFPAQSSFHSHVPETVLEHVFLPFLQQLYARVAPLRKLQSGLLQHYMLYIFITLLVLLAWGRL